MLRFLLATVWPYAGILYSQCVHFDRPFAPFNPYRIGSTCIYNGDFPGSLVAMAPAPPVDTVVYNVDNIVYPFLCASLNVVCLNKFYCGLSAFYSMVFRCFAVGYYHFRQKGTRESQRLQHHSMETYTLHMESGFCVQASTNKSKIACIIIQNTLIRN